MPRLWSWKVKFCRKFSSDARIVLWAPHHLWKILIWMRVDSSLLTTSFFCFLGIVDNWKVILLRSGSSSIQCKGSQSLRVIDIRDTTKRMFNTVENIRQKLILCSLKCTLHLFILSLICLIWLSSGIYFLPFFLSLLDLKILLRKFDAFSWLVYLIWFLQNLHTWCHCEWELDCY